MTKTYNQPTETTKTSRICGELKPVSEFAIRQSSHGKKGHWWYRTECKQCLAIYLKGYRVRIDYEALPHRRAYKVEYMRNRRKENIDFRLLDNLRRRLNSALNAVGWVKGKRTKELLGCDFNFFLKHIENQFKDGMSWDNYGAAWELDHIVPCMDFNLVDPAEQKRCFNYTNIRPLWRSENRRRQAFGRSLGSNGA